MKFQMFQQDSNTAALENSWKGCYLFFMDMFHLLAVVLTLSALFRYINVRFLRFPGVIGVMTIALLTSLGIILADRLGFELHEAASRIIDSIPLDRTLLHGMLSFLIFAGALQVNLGDLLEQKWMVLSLASIGVVLSTIIVGVLSFFAFSLSGLDMPLAYCFLFGALISPTDPISVVAMMKKVKARPDIEAMITGESLLNDGVGVVIFAILCELMGSAGSHAITASHVLQLFAQEAFGGFSLGLAAGGLAFLMLRSIDSYETEILITLALVTGGYALAETLHVSGPMAMVGAGILIGNHGRRLAMSSTTRQHLDDFWSVTDELMNAVLFVLIGLEMLIITVQPVVFTAAACAIPVVLAARMISVSLPLAIRGFDAMMVKLLTWTGLRGGISVALALSLPSSPYRQSIITITYTVVVFSIMVQGLTAGKILKRFRRETA